MKQGKMSEPRLSGLKDEPDLKTKKILKSSNQANPDSDNMQGWEKKTLGDVLEVLRNGVNCKQDKKGIGEKISRIESISSGEFDFEKVGFTSLSDAEKEKYKLQKGDILFSHINSPIHVGKTALFDSDEEIYHGVNLLLMRPKSFLDKVYFEHYLKFIFQKGYWKGLCKQSVNQASVNQQDINKVKVTYPKSLPEQQRIVSILDAAFLAIAKAKAHAEQNLKNAKELFESYLQGVFENGNWETKEFGEIITTLTDYHANGSYQILKTYVELKETEDYAWMVRSTDFENNFKNDFRFIDENAYNFLSKSKVFGGEIIMSKIGNAGNVYLMPRIDRPCSLAMNLFLIRLNDKKAVPEFVFQYLKSYSGEFQIKSRLQGATTKTITKDNVRNILIPLPPLKEQQTIVRQLDALRAETQKLEAVYQKKIDDLEELKKSILQKAFAGELTSSASISVSDAKVIPLQKVEGISATDLQAGITGIALQRHSELNKQDAFGHVKAEKIVHLVEYILNVDLERNPVKDAAGPNDFPHAKKVESRAAKAGFYTVAKRASDQDTGYIYTQGSSIESLIKKTQHCLGERNEILSQLLKLIVPMKTQQAEIVATVYAAWNNLIIKGGEFTDEDIVTEARENWREEKLKIPREKFFNAIEWMKKNELLIPKGRGKIVKAK